MPEQQNIEYKQSWHDDYLKWVCGFANAQGGVIYIGKDDNHKVITAGICLNEGDQNFNLKALISVMREGQNRGLIHRTMR